MTKNTSKKIQSAIDEAAKKSTHLISTPEDIEKLKAQGLPIEEKFIPYEEYFELLVENKRKDAIHNLRQMPALEKSIANGVISAIYEEIRASLGLGIFTSTIFNSIILLEFAMRVCLYKTRLEDDPNTKWEHIEQLKMRDLIKQLSKKRVFSKKERSELENFNDNFRNPYLHINIHELIKDLYLDGVQKVDLKTGETTTENGINVAENPQFWFVGKNIFDKNYVFQVLSFCVEWTNKLLSSKDQNE